MSASAELLERFAAKHGIHKDHMWGCDLCDAACGEDTVEQARAALATHLDAEHAIRRPA